MPRDMYEITRKQNEAKELENKKYQKFKNQTLPRIKKMLKNNRGYGYTLEEIIELFPDTRDGFNMYELDREGSGIGRYDIDGCSVYMYSAMRDPESKENLKKSEPTKKKGFLESILE